MGASAQIGRARSRASKNHVLAGLVVFTVLVGVLFLNLELRALDAVLLAVLLVALLGKYRLLDPAH